MADAILVVEGLVKDYGPVRAVDGISFSIERATCFGLLGPNGAGKTTTIEVIEGVTKPTAGRILYEGEPVGHRFRHEAGIQFQTTALPDYLTVREVLQLFGSFYDRTFPFEELVDLCSLGEFLDRDSKKLSGGQRQRLLLAVALVNDPVILFLDEPTTGLDPQARHNFWALVRKIRARGKTIVLTTHYMEEAYLLADEIAIMDRGRIIARGSPDELLRAEFEGVAIELPAEGFQVPPGFPYPVHEAEGRVEIVTTDVRGARRALLATDAPREKLRVKTPTLEDLFLELTGRELRG